MITCLVVLTAGGPLSGAPVYRSNPALFQIETGHFTVIFPSSARESAEALAGWAEEVYAEVAGRLEVPTNLHLPVVISPDTDELNGFFTPFPSMRIVLYQAPLSPNSGFAFYRDTLRKLFLHELTHAVSLMQTDGWGTFLSAVFGDIAHPGEFYTPGVFIEGVTVSFESADGFGRAADAAYAEVLQQAALEDRWPSLLEASGAWSGYPQGMIYQWGGWFSRYLQETYGGPAYAALFRSFGRGDRLEDFLWFPGAFRQAYGRSLDRVWEEFRVWMLASTPVRVDTVTVDDGPGTITATAAWRGRVYWADFRGVWERRDAENRFVTEEGRYASRLAVSADGTRLLISRFDPVGDLSTAVVVEWDLVAGRRMGRTVPHPLMEASYRGEGLVACRPDGYGFDLVAVEGGRTTVLFDGRHRLVPSQPTAMDDGRISFLLQDEGRRSLAFLDPVTGRTTVVDTGLGGIRQIFSDGKSIWFAWDEDQTFLKLGVLEGERLKVYPPTAGGIHFPVPGSDGVYASALSARGHRLVRLPDLPVTETAAGERPYAPGPPDEPRTAPEVRSFEPWLAALVPQTRVPLPAVNPHATGLGDLFRGVGFATWSSDPTGSVALSTQLSWVVPRGMVDGSVTAESYLGPVAWSFQAFDRLVPDPLRDFDARQSGGLLGLSGVWQGIRETAEWSTKAGASRSSQPDGFRASLPLAATLNWQSTHPVGTEGERWGLGASGAWNAVLEPAASAVPLGVGQAGLRVLLPFLRTTASLSGASVVSGPVSLGSQGPRPEDGSVWLGEGDFAGIPTADAEATARRLVSADVNLGVSLPLRRPLPGIGYASSLDLKTGYGAVWVARSFGDSWYSVASLVFRWNGVPAVLSAPLSLDLRVDVPGFSAPENRVPTVGLSAGTGLY